MKDETAQDAIRVLVADDEESMRHFVSRALRRRGFGVATAASAEEALEILAREPFDVVVTDIRMPGMDGIELLERVSTCAPAVRTILMTAFGSVKSAIDALHRGAENYLTKPFETDELVAAVAKAGEKSRLVEENRNLRRMLHGRSGFGGLIGVSRPMMRLFRQIDQVARRSGTVLVTGESGSGKELVARAVHERGHGSEGPFVAVHCGALPDGLVSVELFGAVKGAYTGAENERRGYVERAQGGTLFLDEVGEIPIDVQSALLRFLEDGAYTPVGGTEERQSSARVVAATNRDLRARAAAGTFREDLFYRLDVLPLAVPPLRERLEDIPLLVTHFMEAVGRPGLAVPPDVMAHLQAQPWPGNVRELRNLAERVASLVDGDVVEIADLPTEMREPGSATVDVSGKPYRAALDTFERSWLEKLLSGTGGNVSEAARVAGMSRPTLHARLNALGIDASAYRGR